MFYIIYPFGYNVNAFFLILGTTKLTSVNATLESIRGFVESMAAASSLEAAREIMDNKTLHGYKAMEAFGTITGSEKAFTVEKIDAFGGSFRISDNSGRNIAPITDRLNSFHLNPEFTRITEPKQNRIDHVNVDINLPNVRNYDEFKTALIRDRQFERTVQEMTLGNALGKNSYSKFRV